MGWRQSACADVKTGAPAWAEPIQLFNGKDLGRLDDERIRSAGVDRTERDDRQPRTWSKLVSNSKFQDFKMHVEFNCGTDSNSGVYLQWPLRSSDRNRLTS